MVQLHSSSGGLVDKDVGREGTAQLHSSSGGLVRVAGTQVEEAGPENPPPYLSAMSSIPCFTVMQNAWESFVPGCKSCGSERTARWISSIVSTWSSESMCEPRYSGQRRTWAARPSQ